MLGRVAWVLVAALLVAGARAQHAAADQLEGCQAIGSLPLVVTEESKCLMLTRDLVWDPQDFTRAIEWEGEGGELHFRGFGLRMVGAVTRGIRTRGHGSLQVYDGYIFSDENQYGGGRAFQSQDNSSIALYNTRIHNIGFGLMMFGTSTAIVDNYHLTRRVNRQSAAREAAWLDGTFSGDGYGIYNGGSGVLSASRVNIQTEQYDDGTGTINPYALFTAGTWSAFQIPFSERNTRNINFYTDVTISAHIGMGMLGGMNTRIEKTTIRMLPMLGNASMPVDSSWDYGSTQQYGILIGGGYPGNQATLRDVTVDATSVANLTEATAIAIDASSAVDIDGLKAWGHSFFGETPYYDTFLTRQRQLAVGVTVFPWAYGVVWGIPATDAITPIRVRNAEIRVLDNSSYGVQVVSDAVTGTVGVGFDNRSSNVAFTLEHSSISGGGVGLLVGAAARQSVRVNDVQFDGQYYGVYLHNLSRNVDVRQCTFTRACFGIYQADNAAGDASRDNTFIAVNKDASWNGGSYLELDGQWVDSANSGCAARDAPFIYDSIDVLPFKKRRSTSDHVNALLERLPGVLSED